VPTVKEWNTLAGYMNETVAGVKLKEAGITHWKAGNVATNESGFTALPGGIWDGSVVTLHFRYKVSLPPEISSGFFLLKYT
jgi:uncharacterized protein (TIGR02145 family)